MGVVGFVFSGQRVRPMPLWASLQQMVSVSLGSSPKKGDLSQRQICLSPLSPLTQVSPIASDLHWACTPPSGLIHSHCLSSTRMEVRKLASEMSSFVFLSCNLYMARFRVACGC